MRVLPVPLVGFAGALLRFESPAELAARLRPFAVLRTAPFVFRFVAFIASPLVLLMLAENGHRLATGGTTPPPTNR